MNDLPAPGRHIHIIAVCGVGMASLAGLLQARGYRVTGSDQNVYPPMSTYLAEIGIEVLPGFRAEHLFPPPDFVIIGNAVSRGNPEAEHVLEHGIPYSSFPQALGQFLIGARQSLVVTGTHGKTTTTALAAWVLTCADLAPGFFVGGVPLNFGSGWHPGTGDYVVLEGDEYDSAFFDKGPKFLHYRPRHVILTSVEFDHADIYRDLEHVKDAFRRLMELIPADGNLVTCGDFPAAAEVARRARCPVMSYGAAGDWQAAAVRFENARSFFTPAYRGKREGEVEAGVVGRHNVQNALAVYAMGRVLGIARGKLLEGFATFRGVKRRQEIKGERRGIVVIDDFAHHPTAVMETIDAVRSAYPNRRLWALFEPRSNTSRRNIFELEFARSLARADRVIISDLYQPEKVPAADRLSVASVVTEINRISGDARAMMIANSQEIAAYLSAHGAAGDVVLVMSNGAFDGVHEKILRALDETVHA
ncbi:MAG TPA: UDP-N-acetylmuramate:L-alanyl-gamma-D-glutamyl-meso-diaminopimelate ligase [Candidatus Binatia bacterium]